MHRSTREELFIVKGLPMESASGFADQESYALSTTSGALEMGRKVKPQGPHEILSITGMRDVK